jgi:hypothetical protein
VFFSSCAALTGTFLPYREDFGAIFFPSALRGCVPCREASFLSGGAPVSFFILLQTIGRFKSSLVLDGSDQLNKKSDVSPKKTDVDGLSGRLGASI